MIMISPTFANLLKILYACFTVGENIIGAPKMRNDFWYPIKTVNFQILN